MQLDIAFIAEAALTDAERAAIGACMPDRWEERYPGAHVRAWTQRPPAYRLVASVDGRPAGNQSVFDIATDTPAFGLGDLCVAENTQRLGVARELVTLAVEDLRTRTDALILTSADKPHVRELFFALGFHAVPDGGITFVEPPLAMNASDWLASAPIAPATPVQVLATC